MEQSNTPSPVSSGFHSVDQSLDPATRVQFLNSEGSKPAMQYAKQRTFELLDVRQGSRVLDVGCGTGEDVCVLAELVGSGGRAVGIDTDPQMIAQAVQRSTGRGLAVEFRQVDVYTLGDPDGSFDGARADRTFLHLADPARALLQMARVVRSGGKIVVQDRDIETRIIDAPNRALTRRIINFWCDNFLGGWNGRQLRRLFLQTGLVDVAVESVTVIDTDYATFDRQYDLKRIVQRAEEARVLSMEEGSGWLAEVEKLGKEGRFFSAVTSFIVSGRKP